MAAHGTPLSPASAIEAEVQRTRSLLKERRLAEALQATDALLAQVPENRDVLHLRALAQRLLGETAAALATLEQLEALHPRFSALYQERGHCYVGLRRAPEAIAAFLRAVTMNPALQASWSMLEGLYRLTGQTDSATRAAEHVATLKKLPAEVKSATTLFCNGELAAAEQVIRAFLLRHGDHIEAMRLLGRIAVAREVLDDAQLLYEALLARAPDYRVARFEYAQLLIERHLHRQAQEQARQLLQADPDDRSYRALYATACVGLDQHQHALRIFRELLPGAAQPAELHLSIAHCLKTLGDGPAAIAAYRAAAAARPAYGDAFWSLANLKTYSFEDGELQTMQRAEAAPATADVDRLHLCFALGKAHEDRQQYQASFDYYTRGNALKRAASRYRIETHELNARQQIEVCTAELFARRRNAGVPAVDPIFIVGLPRSGSTLIEQILASHSAVEGTHELADVPRIVAALQGRESPTDARRYPELLAQLTDEELLRLGEKYLRDTAIYRSGKPRFIDKMPNNFRHIGLIHMMLPRATIIDARREPMACCFGNFKQLFAHGQEFTYSTSDIARYYRSYLELMRHWDTVLPARVLRVQYEELVHDLDGTVHRLLDHCGLKFEPACLDFHRTVRSIRTASSEQVRQPIYRDGLEQWRNFEPWLAPLREALGDALVRYRD